MFLLKVVYYITEDINVIDSSFLFAEPDDFTTVRSPLMFDSESNIMCVVIPLSRDDLLEQAETFEAVLSSEDLYVILTPDVAAITILDTNGMQLMICVCVCVCLVNYY